MTTTEPTEAATRSTRSPRPSIFGTGLFGTSQSRRRKFGRAAVALAESMATPHALDRYLELVRPMTTVHDIRGEVVQVRRQTDSTVTLTLRPTWQFDGFSAGQFVQVGVVIDGIRHTRCYSPATSAHCADGTFELTIKAQLDGLVSNYLREHAEPGLVVSLSQASGVFSLPSTRPAEIVLISGGSGITPVLSMLRTLVDESHAGPISFIHYADRPADVPYRAELDAIAAAAANVTVSYGYTVDDEGEPGALTGFFGLEHLAAAAPQYAAAQSYLCGPPGLMRAVRSVYTENNLSDQLFTEEFAPAVVAPAEGDATGTLSFTASGVTAENNGATLLEQAEGAGLTPEFGCRMGICFSCTAVKRTGCTKNLLTGETDSDPDQPIQLCVSAACGDVEIEI